MNTEDINLAAPNQQKNGFILRPSRQKLVPFSVLVDDDNGGKISRSAVMVNGKRQLLPLEWSDDDLYLY